MFKLNSLPNFPAYQLKSPALLIVFASTVGCDLQPATAPTPGNATVQIPSSTAPKTKKVDNLDFVSWSSYPIGTKVVRTKSITNELGETLVTTSLCLEDRTEKVVSVESQITVKRPTDYTENPPQILDYPAQNSVLESTPNEQIGAPSRDAKLIREETLTVFGKDFPCKVYEWKTTLESGPIDVLGWFSDSFPGRQIKLELDFGESKGTEEITEFTLPQSEVEDK